MSDPTCSNSLLPKTGRQVSKNTCNFNTSSETPVPINKASNSNDNGKIPSLIFTNTTLKDLSKRVENTNLSNCDDDDDEGSGDVQRQESSLASSKKKNLRKRERRKALQIQGSATNPNMTQPIETPNMMTPSSIQDLFLKQITPLYALTNSRYLENLSHHPQFNLIQAHHFKDVIQSQLASSVPNSPLLYYSPQGQQYPAFSSFPNSPEPKYLQNVMQHPLLRQTFHNHNFNQVLPSQVMTSNHSNQHICKEKRENGNQKKVKNHSQKKTDNGFNPYISREEVEKGLKNKELLEGVVRINPKQFTNAYISSTDKSEPDILIDGVKNRNRALEGDIVVIQIIECFDASGESNENKQKQGRVVQIKEKVHSRTCIGSLKLMPDKNKQKALFVPRDYRIPRLNISVLYWPDNFYEKSAEYEKSLFLAKIMDWYDVRFAVGKIVCNIGMAGDMESETKAILAQNDLDVTPYGPEYKSFYPGLDYEIPEEEIKLREDCRNLCIFSIDPFNCRDIDDAVSSRKLENGNYEIGVHISDVSHFLTEGTLLDEKVAERATTIYMVERAYHMLPDELCMLCSLLPGVDKLAFSVFWEITTDGKVLSHRFAKTLINSCCKLAYEHAQSILDDEEGIEGNFPDIYNNFEYKNIYDTVKILGSIASIFRKRRFDGGALRIDQPKISFKLGPNALPESFSIYDSKPSHQLIEEFMLLANMTVAERIFEDHPKLAFLRCHPAPSIYMLNQLAKSLKPIGITLEVQSAGDLHKSLLPHSGPNNPDRGKAMVVNMLCAKPMARAKYFCAGCYDDDFSHYALNVPLYTHFTSPIRRYADVVVHRLLSASLSSKTPEWETDKIRMIAANCNKQKYNAKKAGELSIELYTLKYIELNSPLVTEAVVVDIKDKYLDVIIVAMGLNRRIFLNNDFPGEFNCIKNDAGIKLSKMELVWNATDDLPSIKQEVEVFSILNVEMHKGDDMVKVETKLVRPQ